MTRLALAMPVLFGLGGLAAPAFAQGTPTHADGVAADHRVGSTFSAYGSTIFYQVSGHGTPLVLIHGYPLSGALFRYQQTGLANRFEVITLDLPGFGRSTAPQGFGSDALYARYVLALMDHLGISRAVIGGHSMGGQITQELYREAPERFAGMILIDTDPQAASAIETGEWTGYGVMTASQGESSILPTVTPQLLTGNTLLTTPAVGTAIMDIIAEGTPAGGVGGAEALAVRPDFRGLLPQVRVPTLVLEGVDDVVYGFKVAQAIQAAVPGSTLSLLPNAGHVSVFEAPDAANAAILAWADGSGL